MPINPVVTYSEPNSNDAIGSAPSGYGADYDQLFAANPYRNLDYHQSGWQKFLSKLGFRTGYDAFLENSQVQAQEYDAGIFSQIFQNQYNSELAKSQRMREAGLNPDLLGTGDVANAASPADDPNGMAEQSGEESQVASLMTGFASSMISAFSTGMQIYKNIADVKKVSAEINSLAISNSDRIVDVVDKIIVGSVPISVYDKGDPDAFLKDIDMSKYGFSGSSLEVANTALRDRYDSVKNNADIREAMYRRYNALSSSYELGSKGFLPESQMPASPDDFFNLQTESLARAARRILDLKSANTEFEERVLTPSEQANQSIQNEIELDKLKVLDENGFGEAEATNMIQSTESDTFLKQSQRIINEERARMYSVLRVKADSGDSFATAMLHAMALQDMMQFDLSAGVDLSLLKGLGSIATSLFGLGKSSSSVSDSAKRTFGSGFNFSLGIKSK